MANKRQKKKAIKRLTPNQREYQKQLKLLKRRVATLEKQGYESVTEVVPLRPQRITKKQIELVKNLRGKKLQSKYERVDYNTGEIRSYAEDKAEQRKALADERKRRKGQSQLIVTQGELNKQRLNNFKQKLESAEAEGIKGVVNWYQSMLSTIGQNRMEKILYELEELGIVFNPDDYYGSDKAKYIQNFITTFNDMMIAIPEFKESEQEFEIEEDAEEWEDVGEENFWSGL